MKYFILTSKERRREAAEYVARLPRMMVVEIKPFKHQRSRSQNNVYWMWLEAIAEHTGYTKDELHELMKSVFLGVEIKMMWGRPIEIRKSTTELDTKEFSHYLEKIEAYAVQNGIKLPYPEDYQYAIYGEKISG